MLQHVLYGIFLLILLFLVLSRSGATNALLTTGGGQINQYTRTLQGQ